ncbi:phenylalanine--tRNA ligase subunit beta [Parachlamydia sp. AcF125]|uniref:phenylalanine--tRNA ligase subunit beta n=1 Tax=Parachlamydia sp. AcF125 TaxID=2795736 RepID=UPI001BC9560E|nr:phenylalanine--tRNA ligase subunit beta [Parachlamydia sp. AcF125]MBS4168626.1 Phenylalanine--tRNA ligase beta subunit [Parachlamydia sp. AcF125]
MKIPLSWLKEWINLTLLPHQIEKKLTNAGLEVDALIPISAGFQKVVIGRVLKTEKHPNADKLCVATVTDGLEEYQVVCGAPNCRPGIKTAFAMVGATLEDKEGKTFKIKASKIRGVESFGMLCSASELNLSEGHDGIIEFSEHFQEGADLASIYGDMIFEISLTPNLAHCSSLLGVARELSATTDFPLIFPTIHLQETGKPIQEQVKVIVMDPGRTPRYACRLIQGVSIAPSPDWMQKRLLQCGIRPINNVVDVTNYVLLEMGHPLHAFDFASIEGAEIRVRATEEEEKMITLDGKERDLPKGALLICDRQKPIAIAGIMGAQNSEVNDQTHTVLLEAACFEPRSIRKASKALGLQTDASKRFERGVDPNQVLASLDRATGLIQELAGGVIAQGILDIQSHEFLPKSVTCRLSRVHALLGTALSASEVESIFQKLGFSVQYDGHDLFEVQIPTYRHDVSLEVDLIEEVARIYGYDNIEKKAPRYHGANIPHTPLFHFEREVRGQLIAAGLQEFLTCDLIGPTLLQLIGDSIMQEEAQVKVVNPTSIEQSVLRTSLLPGILQVIKHNWDRQNRNISGFELGRVHFKEGARYIEDPVAAIVVTGKSRPHHWGNKPEEFDFFDLKGIVETFLQELRIPSFTFEESQLAIFHPGRRACVQVGALKIGSLGEVHPSICRKLDVGQRIFFAEFNLYDLLRVRKTEPRMKEVPIYPSSERDWTLTLKNSIPIQSVFDWIHAARSPLLEEVVLLDVYSSEKLGKDCKNVTFRLTYRDAKKTVAQEKVDRDHARIIGYVTEQISSTEGL